MRISDDWHCKEEAETRRYAAQKRSKEALKNGEIRRKENEKTNKMRFFLLYYGNKNKIKRQTTLTIH